MCVCVFVCVCLCAGVRVCVRETRCVCVCVCLFLSESKAFGCEWVQETVPAMRYVYCAEYNASIFHRLRLLCFLNFLYW